MSDSAFFMLRLNDHIQYMIKIQKTLNGCGDFIGTDYNTCKLGQWLCGDGPQDVKAVGNPEIENIFESLFEPHKKFHDVSQKAIQFFDEGQKLKADASVTEMIVLSNKLVDILLKLDVITKNS